MHEYVTFVTLCTTFKDTGKQQMNAGPLHRNTELLFRLAWRTDMRPASNTKRASSSATQPDHNSVAPGASSHSSLLLIVSDQTNCSHVFRKFREDPGSTSAEIA